jgi:thiamine-phosphate diphosphorylase
LPRAPENPHAKPIVCYVTDSGSLASVAVLLDCIVGAAEAGADWIQLREKTWEGRALLDFALQVRARVAHLESIPKLIINDRIDVALSAGAGGVQLGASSIPVEETVRFLRERGAAARFLVCASCHSLDEARAAESAGATHLYFGPVFDSPSKRAFGSPQGLDQLAEVCGAVKLPVIAIGGINAVNARSCIDAGANGVAAIREFQDVEDEGRVKKFVEAVKS